jgi:hypothetical protein
VLSYIEEIKGLTEKSGKICSHSRPGQQVPTGPAIPEQSSPLWRQSWPRDATAKASSAETTVVNFISIGNTFAVSWRGDMRDEGESCYRGYLLQDTWDI